MAPILKELDKRKLIYIFIHTGQHSFGNLLDQFKVKNPDLTLYTPPKKSSLFMNKIHKSLIWGFSVNFKLLSFLLKTM
jgi:UDP-N-acetylglucosamine 2-epimerase